MIDGSYVLKLTCTFATPTEAGRDTDSEGHSSDEFPHVFTEPSKHLAYKAAKKRGWALSDTEAICPKCVNRFLLKS